MLRPMLSLRHFLALIAISAALLAQPASAHIYRHHADYGRALHRVSYRQHFHPRGSALRYREALNEHRGFAERPLSRNAYLSAPSYVAAPFARESSYVSSARGWQPRREHGAWQQPTWQQQELWQQQPRQGGSWQQQSRQQRNWQQPNWQQPNWQRDERGFGEASPIRSMAEEEASSNGIPVSLVDRVIKRESGGNPRAVSQGNYGLMQIRLGTAREMGYRGSAAGLLDASTNMTYAVRYLAGAYRAAGGNEDRAVALYARGYRAAPRVQYASYYGGEPQPATGFSASASYDQVASFAPASSIGRTRHHRRRLL